MTEHPASGAAPENSGSEQAWQQPEPAGDQPAPFQDGARLQPFAQAAPQAPQPSPGAQPPYGQVTQPIAQAAQHTAPLPEFQAPQGYAAPQNASPQNRDFPSPQPPAYPQHQPQPRPFYGGPQSHPTQQFSAVPGPAQNPSGHTLPTHASAAAPKSKAAFGVGTLVASILAAGLVGGGVVAGSSALFGGQAAVSASSNEPETLIVNNKDDVNAITAAAAKASPSVVTIKATSGSEGGTGSGVIIDDQGHILTNTHVVTLDGATANAAIEVRMSDGKVLKATVVGTDPLSDLAVIKVENASGLVPATLGDSGKINVGDTAVAIGSPLGLTGTVTDGIVSTLNRTISVASSAAPKDGSDNSQGDGSDDGFQFAPPGGGQSQSSASSGSISINVIQTDAAINPGNSGGALVNSKGEIIGINVAIASAGSGSSSSSSGNIGVGFSIPINHAKRVAQEIIKSGKASHGQFGVSVGSKTATDSDSGFSVGAVVSAVTSGSAAAKAGIKVGDVVTRFGDRTISDPNQLTAAVREESAGAKVKVTIERNGQSQELDVTLDAAPQP